jgi:putative FmdB family regulatory protein
MPSYEYMCKKCGEKFTIIMGFESFLGLKIICPECKSKKVKKIYTAPNVIFKGGGFYKTDSNKKNGGDE